LIKCKNSTIKKSKEENENLKVELPDKRKQLKEVEKKKDSLKTVAFVISVKIPTCTSFNESLTGGSTTSVFFLDKSNGSFKNAKSVSLTRTSPRAL
jgi:hypothetical protein